MARERILASRRGGKNKRSECVLIPLRTLKSVEDVRELLNEILEKFMCKDCKKNHKSVEDFQESLKNLQL